MPLDKFDNRDSDIWFNHRNNDRSVGRISHLLSYSNCAYRFLFVSMKEFNM